VFDVKRLIGRKYDDKEVQRDKKLLPYNIVEKETKPMIAARCQGREEAVLAGGDLGDGA
jgi:heat shock protein 5